MRNLQILVTILCGIGISRVSAAGQNASPSNLALISAMPPETESVLILRCDRLTAGDSLLRDRVLEFLNGIEEAGTRQEYTTSPLSVVFNHIVQAQPILHVEGGSDFTRKTGSADGLGLGHYTRRSISYVERPLTPLLLRLATNNDFDGPCKPLKIAGKQAYEIEVEAPGMERADPDCVRQPCFIGFPSDRWVITAPTRSELEFMLKTLASPARMLPDNWKNLAASLDIESPLFLIRRYNPASVLDCYSPVIHSQTVYPRVDIEGFALTLPSVNQLLFRMSCQSREPDQAMGHYGSWLPEPQWVWNSTPRPAGFEAGIAASEITEATQTLVFGLLILFGANVFI